MSNAPHPKGHRHTRSAALPPPALSPNNPQNPHHLNSQAQALDMHPNMSPSPQPTTPPRTPRRNDLTQPASRKATPTGSAPGSKKKPRNQRPKNVNTSSSPALTRNSRTTPPLPVAQSAGHPPSTKPTSTPSTAAYAGPTFHASPAPSTLPIPSFYSKSVPDSPGLRKFMKESSLSPKPPLPGSTETREESPLDIFFKADKEEKARARSASSSQHPVVSNGPFQPPSASPQAKETPISGSQNSARRAANRTSSGGIFAMELDGESSPGAPIGPAFSTPYSERINAARTTRTEKQSGDLAQNMSSEALRAYLFSGHQSPSPASTSPSNEKPLTPTAPAAYRSNTAPNGIRSSGPSSRTQSYGPTVRSSGLRQEVSPTRTPTEAPDRILNYTSSPTPARKYGNPSSFSRATGNHIPQTTSALPSSFSLASGSKSADIQGMEDSLRRILKLGPASPSPVNGNLPATTSSVPNYVGGRPPPMNGLHNGVMGS